MSTLMRSDDASQRGSNQGTSDGTLLLDALANLWEQTRHQSEMSKARAIESYAARLANYHAPSVLRVLKEWPNSVRVKHGYGDDAEETGSDGRWWPSLNELIERLPPEDWRPARRALPPPGTSHEAFHERARRMGLAVILSEIGVGQWKHLVRSHGRMSDEGLENALEDLSRRGGGDHATVADHNKL